MKVRKSGALGVLLALVAIIAATVAGVAPAAAAGKPIVIGWADDSSGNMTPFDQPALAAAKVEVAKINAKGGVTGRPLQIVTCDTQGNKPDVAKACGASLVRQQSDIVFTTCDVDYATPVVQEAINAGKLTIAPCIGTDQMGPSRFGAKGKLAFSFGNAAQDEGSAMAQFAWSKGWKTAATGTNTLLVYFKEVVQAFQIRFKQLGGKIVSSGELHDGPEQRGQRRQPAERREGRRLRHVDLVRRASRLRHRASARSATTRRSSTRGPATAPTGCPRPASPTTTP